VLINDYDPDGFIVTRLTYIAPGNGPQSGSVVFDAVDQKFIFTPDYPTCKEVTFTYTIFDNDGDSAQAMVIISPPNEADISALPDERKTYPAIPIELTPLTNDQGAFLPTIDDYTEPKNGSVALGPNNLITYNPEPSFVGRDSMTYTIVTPCGNRSTTYIFFDVTELRVPQIITPNGDRKNDELIIDGIENYPESVIEIYNRNGHIVFSQRGYDNTWTGYSNRGSLGGDLPLPSATYYYMLTYNQGRNRQSGFVYLFR
jgi:gliding motility-associated-like protein